MGDIGVKYSKGKPNKEHGNHIIPAKKISSYLENNAVINNVVDEILLNETQKVSTEREAPYFWTLSVMRTIYIRLRK